MLLALVAGQSTYFQSPAPRPEAASASIGPEAGTTAWIPQAHAVYEHGCGQDDLHVVRYAAGDAGARQVALTFCDQAQTASAPLVDDKRP